MTESETTQPAADSWDGILEALRRRYPGQKDSVLFCIYKLQQNPELTLRDFRAEAALYGIPMAGRALHSARGLLGLQKDEASKAKADKAPAARDEVVAQALPRLARAERQRARQERAAATAAGGTIENQVLAAIRQIQSAAGSEAEQLRAAIREAVAVLQRALGD